MLCFLYPLLTDEHLVSFHILAVVKNASMNEHEGAGILVSVRTNIGSEV